MQIVGIVAMLSCFVLIAAGAVVWFLIERESYDFWDKR